MNLFGGLGRLFRQILYTAFFVFVVMIALLFGDLLINRENQASAWQAVGGYLAFMAALVLVLQTEEVREESRRAAQAAVAESQRSTQASLENAAKVREDVQQANATSLRLLEAAGIQADALNRSSAALSTLADAQRETAIRGKAFQPVYIVENNSVKIFNSGTSTAMLRNIRISIRHSRRQGIDDRNANIISTSSNIISPGGLVEIFFDVQPPPEVSPTLAYGTGVFRGIAYEAAFAGSNGFAEQTWSEMT